MVSVTDESLLPWFTLNVDGGIVLDGKFGRISETIGLDHVLLVIFAFDMFMRKPSNFIGGKV